MDKSKIVKYKGNDYAVGLIWKEINGEKPSVIRGRLRDTINRQKYDGFGVKIEAQKTKIQVGFSSKKAKGIRSLAHVFAGKDEFKGSIIIAKIKDDLFWTVGITQEGFITAGQDNLYSTSDFIDTIGGELQLGDDVNLFIAEDCIDEVEDLLINSLDDIEVNSFDIDITLSGSLKASEIGSVYNKTIDTLMQGAVFAATGAALTLGYMYVYKENPLYNQIIDEEISESFMVKYGAHKKALKKKKKSSNIDQAGMEVMAKTEILKSRNATYSNDDILNYIDDLFNMFSVYLVEWELESISFQNSANAEYFTIKYSRISDSYGFKQQLEDEISKIFEKKGIAKSQYSLGYGSSKGDVLLVNVQFKAAKEFVLGQGEVNQDEFAAEKDKLNKKLEKVKKTIGAYQDSAIDLGFFDKRFGGTLSDMETSIRMEVNKGNKIFKEIKKLNKEFSTQEIEFDESLIGGTRSEMLSMMQQYSYYSWSEASNSKQFPKVTSRSKNPVPAYANAYEFVVNPGGNMDVLGLKGLKDIILNDKLLNKNYVKIKEVRFNLSNEVWEIKGETYEKI